MSKYTKKFKKDLHKLTDPTDLRDSLQYLFFKDGYVYATNAYVLIKQSLKLHNFSEEEIKLLNGYCIHANAFAMLRRFDVLQVVNAGEINASKDGVSIVVKLSEYSTENTPDKVRMLDCDQTLDNAYEGLKKAPASKYMALNPSLLKLLSSCLFDSSSVVLRYSGKNKAIVVEVNSGDHIDQKAVIMPVTVDEACLKRLGIENDVW